MTKTDNNVAHVAKVRHSLAHLLAIEVLKFDSKAKLAIGPVIDNGFYYDFEFSEGKAPTEKDLKDFKKGMKKLIGGKLPFTYAEVTADEAKKMFADQPYKMELIADLVKDGATLSVYKTGEKFTDLCAGPHVENTSEIDADGFELTKIAGAYWRGSEKNKMLTRIYGVAFETGAELDAYKKNIEEAEKRDHRKIGDAMDIFYFDEEIGKGLPIWLPNGNIIKEQLENWAKETEEKWGYQRVTTPLITKEHLFHTSGHLPLYKDSMYAPIVIEDENYYIKPMNCPFHHKTFAARPKSYRDLPVRLAEYGWCHRFEDSGSLFGLMRVRGMQMNDAHIYIQKENAVDEFVNVIKMHEYYYKILGITNYEMELALRDPNKMDKYHGDEGDWKDAENMTVEAMKKSGVPFKIVNEGAAFYGPKMDFQIFSSIGRAFTASTNQLDLYMGKKFGLEYTDKDSTRKTPAIIHRAPLGTHERFIGFLIEHFAGNFPTWLAPIQVAIIPVRENHDEAAKKLHDVLRDNNIRCTTYGGNSSLGKRIHEAKNYKPPYLVVIGDKEVESKTFQVELRSGEKIAFSEADLVSRIKEEITTRLDQK